MEFLNTFNVLLLHIHFAINNFGAWYIFYDT